VLVGIAVMAAPFALSVMADAWGVGPAFAIEPALIALAVILLAATAGGVALVAPNSASPGSELRGR
jgi:hypothetical protein